MSVFATAITTTVDYALEGKQVGRLHLPYSVTRSAYGVIPVPIAVVAKGSGPTVLLMAGNHGDEYEGQIALGNLIRKLDPKTVNGRIIILPSANLPAARAGVRVSPLDDANLNRVFPAGTASSPTHEIAAYLEQVLFPMSDIFMDLHSGGASLTYIPFVAATMTGDVQRDRRALELVQAFGGPFGQLGSSGPGSRTAGGAAVRAGCIALSGEFGGFGIVDRNHLKYVESGVHNLLVESGVLDADPIVVEQPTMRLMSSDAPELYLFAPDYGVFVPEVDLGDVVDEGALGGTVQNLEHPERAPLPVHFRVPGKVICMRAIGRVEPGDCLMHQAVDIAVPDYLT